MDLGTSGAPCKRLIHAGCGVRFGVRDGHLPYRVFTSARSQTRLAHLLRRIRGLLENHTAPAAVRWLRKVKNVLQRAIAISQRRDAAEIGPHGLVIGIGKAEAEMDRLLATVPKSADIGRLARHLERERSALFTTTTSRAGRATR